MNISAASFHPNETENSLYPLQTSIWTHQTQALGKQPGEAGRLTAVALVRGIYSGQGSVVSMGTALLVFAGSPRLARCTERKIGGEKEGQKETLRILKVFEGTLHWMRSYSQHTTWAIWLQHSLKMEART